ncbi:RusA family crossover junction endodeoxyribonuclease [Streptococcus agalactiae]|nr:RusA family crossover junction endodeoxyribonuclease [Streptococcus agalactiae]
MVKKQRIYAIYHDDRFVDVGTKEELMERLGIKKQTIEQYMTKSYQARPSSKRIAIFDSISDAGYDKIQKSGIVWSDDNIVCDLRAIKKYSPNPRIKVKIEEIDERTNG